jgi:hypothetical protein
MVTRMRRPPVGNCGSSLIMALFSEIQTGVRIGCPSPLKMIIQCGPDGKDGSGAWAPSLNRVSSRSERAEIRVNAAIEREDEEQVA